MYKPKTRRDDFNFSEYKVGEKKENLYQTFEELMFSGINNNSYSNKRIRTGIHANSRAYANYGKR
jgi:hypothetical protein